MQIQKWGFGIRSISFVKLQFKLSNLNKQKTWLVYESIRHGSFQTSGLVLLLKVCKHDIPVVHFNKISFRHPPAVQTHL